MSLPEISTDGWDSISVVAGHGLCEDCGEGGVPTYYGEDTDVNNIKDHGSGEGLAASYIASGDGVTCGDGNGVVVDIDLVDRYRMDAVDIDLAHDTNEISHFKCEYWDGASWQTPSGWDQSGGSYDGVQNLTVGTPFITTKIRVSVIENNCCDSGECNMLYQVKIYGVPLIPILSGYYNRQRRET